MLPALRYVLSWSGLGCVAAAGICWLEWPRRAKRLTGPMPQESFMFGSGRLDRAGRGGGLSMKQPISPASSRWRLK